MKAFNPKEGNFQRFNNADIDRYMSMTTDPLLVDPKVEVPSKLCGEEGTTLEPTFHKIDSWLPH